MKFFTCLAAKNNDRNINMLQSRGFLRKAKYNGPNFALGRCTGALPGDFWGNFMSVFKQECNPHTWHIKCTSLSLFFFFSLCLYSLCTYLCAFLFAKRPFTIILLFSQFLYNIYLSMKGFLLNVGGRNFILNAFSRGSCFEKLGWILDIQENRMPLPLCMKMHTCVLVNGQNLGASGVRGKVQGTSWWGKRRSNLIV